MSYAPYIINHLTIACSFKNDFFKKLGNQSEWIEKFFFKFVRNLLVTR